MNPPAKPADRRRRFYQVLLVLLECVLTLGAVELGFAIFHPVPYSINGKYSDNLQDRHQDNPTFKNERSNLFESADEVVEIIRSLFSDPDVRQTLQTKVHISPSRELADSLSTHEAFDFFFTEAGRFQNIYVDIPPKFMSFVFYILVRPFPAAEDERNATILYDNSLAPHITAP